MRSTTLLFILTIFSCSTQKKVPAIALEETMETVGQSADPAIVMQSLELSPEAISIVDQILRQGEPSTPNSCLLLLVQGVKVIGLKNSIIDVYLNLAPDQLAEGRESPNYLGTFTTGHAATFDPTRSYNFDLFPAITSLGTKLESALSAGTFDIIIKASPLTTSVEGALPRLSVEQLKLQTTCD